MHLSRIYQGLIRTVKLTDENKKIGIKYKKAILFNKYPNCYIDLSSSKVYCSNKNNLSVGERYVDDKSLKSIIELYELEDINLKKVEIFKLIKKRRSELSEKNI